MKKMFRTTFIMAVALMILTSCGNSGDTGVKLAPNAHKVKAEEVIQTDRYTYIRVSSEDTEYWIATNRMEVKEGAVYYWSVGYEMKEFTSKDLKRTFRSIYFVEDFTDQPITADRPPTAPPQEMTPSGSMAGRQQMPEKPGIKVEKAEGGITIGELYGNSTAYSGKKVKIRGEVVKYSPGIMNRNWVHLQDGTRSGDHYDLTFTTLAEVQVGNVVILEGTVALNKDFGAGYVYDVIVEESELK